MEAGSRRCDMKTMFEIHQKSLGFDVCVIGGGMAGLCAAIASARNGARTCLVQDRPMLGGNASSEVRMWVCGAHGRHNKEAGILEEIQLENCYRNPSLNYSVWDSVLWSKAHYQPGLTLLLNASCIDAQMEGARIKSVEVWQLTSQTKYAIEAAQFIDCSGDSILAPLTGALCRHGREGRDEFHEDIEPMVADEKTMGNSLLIQWRLCDGPQPYTPPRWAYKFMRPEDIPNRMKEGGTNPTNFWWMELGGLVDTVADAEMIRDQLLCVAYGVWDYIKNYAPQREKAANWALEWVGMLPGKRENRRYVGDHIMTQNDVRAGGKFDDVVAYGGWSMDDHHPAGMLYPGKPTIFHPAPSPYGIAYRTLYSKNIDNLLFAGRNISVTHAALSSTRVMGTCSILGQAAGTAAALCIRHGCSPRAIYHEHIKELQHILMDDDSWLPGLVRPVGELTRSGALTGPGQGVELLRDGHDRDREDEVHAWEGELGAKLEYRWESPQYIGGIRLLFDSNLNNTKRMACNYPQRGDRSMVPASLVREYRIDVSEDGQTWRSFHHEKNNYQRLVRLGAGVRVRGVRLVPLATWGDQKVRIFGFEPESTYDEKIPAIPDGAAFAEIVAAVRPADLAPPESGLESPEAKMHSSA